MASQIAAHNNEEDSYELYSKLFQLNNRLINTNSISSAASHIPTPMLVLIGDQSAGKSSLVEALGYGIRLPRDAGACTRAPLELRLQTNKCDDGSACKISVRPFGGQEQEVTRISAATFRPATSLTTVVTNITQQLLTGMRPQDAPPEWPTIQQSQHISALNSFTKDTIVLDIYEATTPLTIVDLPGVIKTQPVAGATLEQRQADAKFPTELAVSYAKRDDVIVVCVMDSFQESQQWGAYDLATEIDDKKIRTVGVLTKADKVLGPGNANEKNARRAQMEQALRTPSILDLALGCYVVSNPLDNARYGENRRLEMDIFKSDSELYSTYGERLGVENLRKALSALLAKRIIANLQNVKSQLDKQYHAAAKTVKELEERRKRLNDPGTMGDNLVYSVTRAISDLIHKSMKYHNDDILFIKLGEKFETFAKQVRSTQPALVGPDGKALHDLEYKEDGFIGITPESIIQKVQAITDIQPNQSAPMTVQKIHDELLVGWQDFAKTCLDESKDVLLADVMDIVNQVTKGRLGFGELVKNTLTDLIADAYADTAVVLDDRCKQETSKQKGTPNIISDEIYTYFFTMHKKQQQEEQEIKMKLLDGQVGSLKVDGDDSPTQFAKSPRQVLEHFSQALVMWRFAHDRFVDGVPMEIVYHLLKKGFENKVFEVLNKAWKKLTPEKQLRLMEDNPQTKQELAVQQGFLRTLEILREEYNEIMRREDVAPVLNPSQARATSPVVRPITPRSGHSRGASPLPPPPVTEAAEAHAAAAANAAGPSHSAATG